MLKLYCINSIFFDSSVIIYLHRAHRWGCLCFPEILGSPRLISSRYRYFPLPSRFSVPVCAPNFEDFTSHRSTQSFSNYGPSPAVGCYWYKYLIPIFSSMNAINYLIKKSPAVFYVLQKFESLLMVRCSVIGRSLACLQSSGAPLS